MRTLVSSYLSERKYEAIPLNRRTLEELSESDAKVRSFTLTETSLSPCISKEVNQMSGLQAAQGVDRNLCNVTVGDSEEVTHYDVSKPVEVAETSAETVGCFKRDDTRIRTRISSKYGRRGKERTEQILHMVSKGIVENAKAQRHAIVFEGMRGFRRLYRKGNGRGRGYRLRMNSWPFGELSAKWSTRRDGKECL